jgi:hypothetical protein
MDKDNKCESATCKGKGGELKFKGFDMDNGWIYFCEKCKGHTFSKKDINLGEEIAKTFKKYMPKFRLEIVNLENDEPIYRNYQMDKDQIANTDWNKIITELTDANLFGGDWNDVEPVDGEVFEK